MNDDDATTTADTATTEIPTMTTEAKPKKKRAAATKKPAAKRKAKSAAKPAKRKGKSTLDRAPHGKGKGVICSGDGKNRFALNLWVTAPQKAALKRLAKSKGTSIVGMLRHALKLPE